MSWRIQGTKLIGITAEEYDIHPREFWYVVPARTHYSPHDGKKIRPLEFAFVLHNAALAKGLLPSPTVMNDGITPRTLKGGSAKDAEMLLEAVRIEHYPTLPSRLRCYFLNLDKDVAIHRMVDSLRGNKTIVRCLLVLNGAKVHFADSRIYERLDGRPDDKSLAMQYWKAFDPRTDEDRRSLEVLVDGALYFPDWKTFPTIPTESLVAWQIDNPPESLN